LYVGKILQSKLGQGFLYKIKADNEIKIIEGYALKKSLIVFAVALALSLVLILLSLLGGMIMIIYASPSLVGTMNNAFSLLYLLVSVFAAFAVFYYLGRKTKIKVVKSITLALFFGLLVGVLVGYLILFISLTFISNASFSWVTSIKANISDISGLLNPVFELFFPALAALLFVDLRERNSHNDLSP
jgi:Na+/H+-translocating membrane pyrophosphatase